MNYTLEHFEKEIGTREYTGRFVDVEKFEKCCAACPSYGQTWSCPPFDFDVTDYWHKYRTVKIYGYRVRYEGERTLEEMIGVLWKVRQQVSDELKALEEQEPGSISILAGRCEVCSECARLEGKPCRFPQRVRHSVESLGTDVGKLLKELFGIEIEWAKEGCLPEYFVLTGGLLRQPEE